MFFFLSFKQFLEAEKTRSQPIIVRECIFKKSELMFHVTLNSQGHNFYKLKYTSLEEVKIVPFQQ